MSDPSTEEVAAIAGSPAFALLQRDNARMVAAVEYVRTKAATDPEAKAIVRALDSETSPNGRMSAHLNSETPR